MYLICYYPYIEIPPCRIFELLVTYYHKFKIFTINSQNFLDSLGNLRYSINELIDKILVHQQTKVNGKKYQQIDIYYSGVGIISVSANEYDFEKEFQNILKNNRKTA